MTDRKPKSIPKNVKIIAASLLLILVFLSGVLIGTEGKQRFVITGVVLKNPVVARGTDRLFAVSSIGLTVWTEEEWNGARKDCLRLVKDDGRCGKTFPEIKDIPEYGK